MTTAVEPVATELSVGTFGSQRDALNGQAHTSHSLWNEQLSIRNGKSTSLSGSEAVKLEPGFEPTSQSKESLMLPHWMDSYQNPNRSKEKGSRIEFIPELGPSTPLQSTPKQPQSVETPLDSSGPLSGPTPQGKRTPLPLEFVEESTGLKQVQVQQLSFSPSKLFQAPEGSQKENMLAFSLSSQQTPQVGAHRLQLQKGLSPQPRPRVGQPPSTRALATLAAPKMTISPEDLQLQQPFKGLQQSANMQPSYLYSGPQAYAAEPSKRPKGTGIISSATGNSRVQLDLFKSPTPAGHGYEASAAVSFVPVQQQASSIPRTFVADVMADGGSRGIARPLREDPAVESDKWLRSRVISNATASTWQHLYHPPTAQAGLKQLELCAPSPLSQITLSPGMVAAPPTPAESGLYMQLLTASPAKDSRQSRMLHNTDRVESSIPSMKRKLAGPGRDPQSQQSNSHGSPHPQEKHFLGRVDAGFGIAADLSRYSSTVGGVGGVNERDQNCASSVPTCAADALSQYSSRKLDAAREHIFFPAGKLTQVGSVKGMGGILNRHQDHPQFASPTKDYSQQSASGMERISSECAVGASDTLNNCHFSARPSRDRNSDLPLRTGKCFAVPAHSPMPVPDISFSAGEPSLPLALNFTPSSSQSSKVERRMSSVKPDLDWGKSLALASSPATFKKNVQDLPYQERFAELQRHLRECDESSQESLLQVFRSMSAAGRSGHALHLETRALFLSLEEGKEMDKIKSMDLMGFRSGCNSKDSGDLGRTPLGPRLPAPGNTAAS